MRFSFLSLSLTLASLTMAQASRPRPPHSGSRDSSLPPRPPGGSNDGFFNGNPRHGPGSGSHPGADAGQDRQGHWPVGSGSHAESRFGAAHHGRGRHEDKDAGFQPSSPHPHEGSQWRDAGSFNGEMKPPGGIHCGHGNLRNHGSDGSHYGRGPGSGCGQGQGQGGPTGDATTSSAPPS